MKPKNFKDVKSLEKEISAYLEITQKKFKKKEELPPYLLFEKELQTNKTLPSSDSSSSTKKKFTDHNNYKKLVNDLNYPNGLETSEIDTWYKDPYYGRVDYKKNLIYHNYWMFQNISPNSQVDICVFDFVADAFEEMKTLFNKKKKNPNSTFLTELVPIRGNSTTISPEIKYENHVNQMFADFLNKRNRELKLSPKIKDFNDFKEVFTNFLKERHNKITFQGFFNNLNVNIYDSYLAFDLYNDLNNPSDHTKLLFLKDLNYNLYEKCARQSGFIVDQNKPWRLIADLNSKPIVLAMKRRLKVAEILLAARPIIEGAMSSIKLIKKEKNNEQLLKAPGLFVGTGAFVSGVGDKISFLKFVDYFRDEIREIKPFIKELRDLTETFLVPFPDKKINQINFGKKNYIYDNVPNPGDKFSVPENFHKLCLSIANISVVLHENEDKIRFIFQSLEDQIKILQTINKPIEKIIVKDVYDAVYCQISDYTYFTYFPRKLEEFYIKFINQQPKKFYPSPMNILEATINEEGKFNYSNYNSYVTFSKYADGSTKAIYHKRNSDLTGIKLSSNISNNFYTVDFLADHLENRLFEENKIVNSETKNLILTYAKELYQKSYEEFEKGKNYFYYRNLSISVIETFIQNLIMGENPIKNFKKAPFYAQQFFYQVPGTEPILKTERLCLTLPEKADIMIEQDVCGKFDGLDDLFKEKPIIEPEEQPPLITMGYYDLNEKKTFQGNENQIDFGDPNGTNDAGLEWIDVLTEEEYEIGRAHV